MTAASDARPPRPYGFGLLHAASGGRDPVGYRCGETCGHNLNSPEGWAAHVTGLVLAALGGREQP